MCSSLYLTKKLFVYKFVIIKNKKNLKKSHVYAYVDVHICVIVCNVFS